MLAWQYLGPPGSGQGLQRWHVTSQVPVFANGNLQKLGCSASCTQHKYSCTCQLPLSVCQVHCRRRCTVPQAQYIIYSAVTEQHCLAHLNSTSHPIAFQGQEYLCRHELGAGRLKHCRWGVAERTSTCSLQEKASSGGLSKQ